jgi:hypothetical protein
MPQLYPQPVSSTVGVTVVAGAGLFGGGTATLNKSVTVSAQTTRQQYPTTPVPDGSNGSFTIQGPVPGGYTDIFVGGLLQPTSAYTLSGSQVAFVTPPAASVTMAAVYATPVDARQQYGLTPIADGTITSFTFPTGLPNGAYVDVYSADGHLLIPGTDYTLNRVSGNWTVVFTTAPAASATPFAIFTPDIVDDRAQYALAPVPNGTTTRFRIVGGAPETTSVDVFDNGFYQVSAAATLNIIAGEWVIDFTTAPTTGHTLLVVF